MWGDLGDPYAAALKSGPYVDELGAAPGTLRIALMTAPSHADCEAAAHHAAALCRDLGHSVEEASPEVDQGALARDFMVVFATSAAWTVDYLMRDYGDAVKVEEAEFEPQTWALLQWGWKTTGPELMLAQTRLQRLSREVAKFFARYDVLLTPTLGEPPLRLGTLDPKPGKPLAGTFRAGQFIPFTSLANVTGQPAMSVPLFWNEGGLPIGVQFAARFGDEATLFRLAAQLEEACPWAQRRPPL